MHAPHVFDASITIVMDVSTNMPWMHLWYVGVGADNCITHVLVVCTKFCVRVMDHATHTVVRGRGP